MTFFRNRLTSAQSFSCELASRKKRAISCRFWLCFCFGCVFVTRNNILYSEILDLSGIKMIDTSQRDSTENCFTHWNFPEYTEQLEREYKLLNQRFYELVEIEQQLLRKISSSFYFWRQKNEEKKEKVRILKRKSEELDEVLFCLTRLQSASKEK